MLIYKCISSQNRKYVFSGTETTETRSDREFEHPAAKNRRFCETYKEEGVEGFKTRLDGSLLR